jgi:putative heme iron utilization protein
MNNGNGNAARTLLLQESFGVLSTVSIDVPGYPFGSVTPYCIDRMCRPIIYISQIAQHTKNILADSRVSLTVVEKGESDDVQAQGRVTCIADARQIDGSDDDVRERYFRYFPSARQYDQTHDFEFFRLELVRVRFIGGFGQIFWVEPSTFMATNPFSRAEENRIVQHMNKDHSDALSRYIGGGPGQMAGIDGEGFDVLRAGKKIRIPFTAPVTNMEQARQALVEMARRPA